MSGKVIPDMERTPSLALIRGACHSCGSGPPLAQRSTKGGYFEAWEPMFVVPTVPPQTLAVELILSALKQEEELNVLLLLSHFLHRLRRHYTNCRRHHGFIVIHSR
jgi:hypothetical protein